METAEQAPTRLSIDAWSDIVCPFCYLGEHRLSQAIARSPHADRIDLRIHTFQLDPALPALPSPRWTTCRLSTASRQRRPGPWRAALRGRHGPKDA